MKNLSSINQNQDIPTKEYVDNANVLSATKLTTARTIGVSEAVNATAISFNGTSNISIPINSIKEPYLVFGGKNIVGTVSPVDMAINNGFSANRFSFMSADDILIEYSNDNGVTWVDYGASNSDKINLVTNSRSFTIGKKNSNITINDKLRITLTAASGKLYTSLKKLHLNISTNGASGSNVILQARTVGNYNNNVDTWVDVNSSSISGWSGWNVLNQSITFGGGTTQTSNYRQIRLTFSITGVSATYASALTLIALYGYGENLWSSPSTLAATNHLYSFDDSQNATFPAIVAAPSFRENGTFLGDKYYLKSNPSNYISEITSSMVITALGYTPYNSTNPNGYTTNTGTVTSVGMSVPTGFTISGTPITSSGTLAVNFANGYTGYTTTEKAKLAGIATGATANTGTVTSIGIVAGTGIGVSGSPITESGTITVSNSGVTSVNGSTGAITNVAKTNVDNNFSEIQTFNKDAAYKYTSTFYNCDSAYTSAHCFGLYQWDDKFQYTRRNASTNVWEGTCFEIDAISGVTDYKATPTVNGSNVMTAANFSLSGTTLTITI